MGHKGSFDANKPQAWSGRLALRVDNQPPQTFAALFDLSGTPEAGELVLTTPVGSTLARIRWSAHGAVYDDGKRKRDYDSLEALIEAATGAPLPVRALFDWLAGRDANIDGWHADLTQVTQGRLVAQRRAPLPTAELRVAFEAVAGEP